MDTSAQRTSSLAPFLTNLHPGSRDTCSMVSHHAYLSDLIMEQLLQHESFSPQFIFLQNKYLLHLFYIYPSSQYCIFVNSLSLCGRHYYTIVYCILTLTSPSSSCAREYLYTKMQEEARPASLIFWLGC